MLKPILGHIDFLTEQIELLDQEVAKRVNTYQEDIERLDSIPGIATRMAEQILAEIGTNITVPKCSSYVFLGRTCSWT
jgi:transposase